MYRILICEDEENIVSFLHAELVHDGFEADAAFDGEQALLFFAEKKYDLILLDIMLPIKNGLEILQEIRKTSTIPIIIVTAKKEVYDKISFLNAGADDYVTKPFDTLELIARIKRNIERNNLKKISDMFYVDELGYRMFVSEHELPLTKTEFEILLFLYKNNGVVKTRNEIIYHVFGEFYGESNIIDVNIKNIRAKIYKYTDTEIINTVRGKGYVMRI
ncbi:response regulator transcription factor [Lachnospiraceae bacterium ZAX-1]